MFAPVLQPEPFWPVADLDDAASEVPKTATLAVVADGAPIEALAEGKSLPRACPEFVPEAATAEALSEG